MATTLRVVSGNTCAECRLDPRVDGDRIERRNLQLGSDGVVLLLKICEVDAELVRPLVLHKFRHAETNGVVDYSGAPDAFSLQDYQVESLGLLQSAFLIELAD